MEFLANIFSFKAVLNFKFTKRMRLSRFSSYIPISFLLKTKLEGLFNS